VRTEIARLLGWPGKPRTHQGAVSRRRLWRQALHQAGGVAVALSMLARRPVKVANTMEEHF